MKKIKNKFEFDELIEKIKESISWYERKNFDDKIYNLTLDNGEKLRIVFGHSSIAHLLGINTEYLKSTGSFPNDSYNILKQVANNSYRLYNMIMQGNLTYDSFISDYAYEKLDSFTNICGINLYDIDFVCKYNKENSYITGYPQLEADYFIGYKGTNGYSIIGLKRNDDCYYPMTNRYIEYDNEEEMKFLKQLLTKQVITMPTVSSIHFVSTDSNSRALYLDYNKKCSKIRRLKDYAQNYDSIIDVGVGYSFILEKLVREKDNNSNTTPLLAFLFDRISKRVKIDCNEVELKFGLLSEEVLTIIDNYNASIDTDISAAMDAETKKM